MARERKRPDLSPADLPMTPMIDVVFQLLIYFLVTIRPIDVFTHLEVARPSPEAQRERLEVPKNLLRINIFKEGFALLDRPVSYEELDRQLTRAAELDKKQSVLIMVSSYSEHAQLIQVLDLCAKLGLTNLSVISTN